MHHRVTFGTLPLVGTVMRVLLTASLLLWLSACAATLKPEMPKSVAGGMRFVISAPAAKSVALVGSFNGWSSTMHRMTPLGSNGLWSVVVLLPQGEHTFMYLVDGKIWMAPPLAEDFVKDGFGQTNGIVVVR